MCLLALLFSLAPLLSPAFVGERAWGNSGVWQGDERSSAQVARRDISYEVELTTEPVPYPVVFRTTSQLRPGHLRKIQHGVPGVAYRAIQKKMKGGQVVGTSLLWETIYPPVPAVILVGEPTRFISRGSYRRTRHLTLEATAYCPGGCCGTGTGRTASGVRAGFGVVAVDPQVIPLGSVLYVEGYGFALAADVGKGVRGNRIDLGFFTHREALRFGRKAVRVHILEEE